jgi:hypothetical protein
MAQPIRQLARYEVRPQALDKCLAAIHEFVAYVRLWQEVGHPTRFVHIFTFRDAETDRAHSESAEVKKFASILYPECLAPVEFIDYTLVDTNVEVPAR